MIHSSSYHIFSLLSACAYVPTGRKHALVLDHAIIQVIKAHADYSKSMKFERSIMLSTIAKMLDSKLACDRLDICAMQVQGSYMRLYVKCA